MSDLLSIGSSGVAAYQRALTTVSNNISNVGTEGYVRQETALAENMPRQQGRVYLGTGASVVAVRRAYDQFLSKIFVTPPVSLIPKAQWSITLTAWLILWVVNQ